MYVCTGDFNARVGKDWQAWDSLGRHGVGSMNGNGQLLLQLCMEFNLFISSIQFCHKGDHITTWMHPRSRQWHLLGYVIVRQRDMQDVCNVRTLRAADCWTDHALVRATFRMVIKPAARLRTIVKLPKRLDVSKLHSAEFQEALAEGMNAVAYTSPWDATKDDLYKVAEETVGTVAARSRDWFDENDQAISDVLAAKNNIRSRIMQKDLSKDQERQLSEALKQAKADAQRKLRSMQDAWWSNLAAEMQAAADMKNSKELYNLTKQAFGPKTARITQLRSKDVKEVHNTMEKISNRWKEHFSKLLNRKSQVDPAALERMQQRPKVNLLNDLPTLEEVRTSISKLNLGKAAGRDGLFSEIFRFGGDHIAVVMRAVILDLWEKGEVPKNWRDAIMFHCTKVKGQVKAKCVGTTEALLFCRQLERYWQVYFYHDSMPKS